MSNINEKPSSLHQEPAEGSRKVVEHELARKPAKEQKGKSEERGSAQPQPPTGKR
jgi:hypothetical protein